MQDFIRLITGELKRSEFERLVTDETRGMYEFYLRSAASVEGEQNRVLRALKFAAAMFRSFLAKLTPSRRFVYAVALLLCIVGYSQSSFGEVLVAFAAVSFLLAMEVAEKLLTRDELALARDIQEGLHPSEAVTVAGFETTTICDVAREVGGDFFDLIPLSDGSTMAVVGDVSGKGISSALYAVKAQTALQIFAHAAADPRMLLAQLNEHLYHQIKRGYFLTVALARMEPAGNVQFCRAGHPPALLFRAADQTIRLVQSRGVAVGMTPGVNGSNGTNGGRNFEDLADVESWHMESGDILALYSDGIVEATDRGGREFGAERLATIFRTFHREPIDALRDRIAHALDAFRGDAELKDDTTLVLLRKTP